jgi:hypothetical protein
VGCPEGPPLGLKLLAMLAASEGSRMSTVQACAVRGNGKAQWGPTGRIRKSGTLLLRVVVLTAARKPGDTVWP